MIYMNIFSEFDAEKRRKMSFKIYLCRLLIAIARSKVRLLVSLLYRAIMLCVLRQIMEKHLL